LFGNHPIDLSGVEQIADLSQTRSLGQVIHYALKYMDGQESLGQVVDSVRKDVEEKRLDVLSPMPVGDLAGFRIWELAAAINRLRTLRIRHS
jgi:ubiquinone biosynthesis protein UbiJ